MALPPSVYFFFRYSINYHSYETIFNRYLHEHQTKYYIIIFKGVNKITFEDEYKTLINIAMN